MDPQSSPRNDWTFDRREYLLAELRTLRNDWMTDQVNDLIDGSGVYLLHATLDRIERLIEATGLHRGFETYAQALRDRFEELPLLVAAKRGEELLNLTERIDAIGEQWIDERRNRKDADPALQELLRSMRQEHIQARILRESRAQHVRTQDETQRAMAELKEATESAAESASKAQESAGLSGSATLSEYFGHYAKLEIRTSQYFRGATIAVILTAIGLAVTRFPVTTYDVTGAAYRLAVLAGIAALGTYLGRQSAQHRRIGNWARGLEIQMQSFPAFVDPVTDDATRNAIYETFARRVLGAPPESSKNTPADNGLLVEPIVTALLKRSA